MSARILVTGSRYWDDRETMRIALETIGELYGRDAILVHGACTGADTIAAEL